jgi:tyrosyl-tRNA synthetase
MLTFDSVKLRLEREQPLTFLEFNYMLMQAVDFLELERRQNCILQMGGSDQWGNIVNGVDLIRRMDAKPAFGLTTPLITTASGAKMGKTAAGAVWLNADRLAPYDYWQFWRNTEDGDVGRFLKLFTDLELDEIARLEALEGSGINEAKKVLADEATTLLHGREAAEKAHRDADAVFRSGATTDSLKVYEFDWAGTVGWTERRASALVAAAQLAPSLKQARQRISQGVRINDQLITTDQLYSLRDRLAGFDAFKVQVGNKIVLVKPV